MFAAKDTLLTRPSGYQISRSVRLRRSASAYLNRTLGSGNRQTWTWSKWIKRANLTDDQFVFHTYGAGGFGVQGRILFNPNSLDFIFDYNGGSQWRLTTTQVFRDPSAWYHIVVVADTTNATSGDRLRMYVNGIRVTSFSSANYPTQNANGTFNQAYAHAIGADTGAAGCLDGYLTEINFIDGQALTPSSFGETNAITGVWQPKKYGGTYGTNGFYLNFSDNSGATATTIGKDYSGNGNNWTPNNISVTAGVTYDAMLDVPTLTSATVANYAVLNPLKNGGTAPSSGNLNIVSSDDNTICLASIGMSSGKWYWEQVQTAGSIGSVAGIAQDNAGLSTYIGGNANSWGYHSSGLTYTNATSSSYGNTWTTNDIIGVAFDADNGKLYFSKNGTFQNSGNPVTGTNPAYSSLTTTPYFPAFQTNSSTTSSINFGQRPFAYTPPTGYVALNTQNLPAPTISNGASYMAATTYTGTGASLTIANTVGSASFQPDLVWVKGRSGATDHAWYDAVRGVEKQIESNNDVAETTETTGLTAFGTTGFTIGALAQMNTSAATYVGWQWNAGGSTVTNTTGTISAQVRANTTAGFSVVTYTGTGANATVGHGLGVAPSIVIVKNRTASSTGWPVYHQNANASPASGGLRLNLTDAFVTYSPYWNNTVPTSTVFSLGSDNQVNGSTNAMVAYCFSAVAGYSAIGSYTGNGSADGTFVYTGFRPRWLLLKNTGGAASWYCLDSSRSAENVVDDVLIPNTNQAEAAITSVDFLSNGFKLRTTTTDINGSGTTYIYAAFAENPFKLSLAR